MDCIVVNPTKEMTDAIDGELKPLRVVVAFIGCDGHIFLHKENHVDSAQPGLGRSHNLYPERDHLAEKPWRSALTLNSTPSRTDVQHHVHRQISNPELGSPLLNYVTIGSLNSRPKNSENLRLKFSLIV